MAKVPNCPGDFASLVDGDDHLKETQQSSRLIHAGYYLKLYQDQVSLPNGDIVGREYLVHPGAVAILPLLDDGRILIERQYRYPLKQAILEIPAGKLDPEESTLVCAQRELKEETGYTAKYWDFLGKIHPVISHSTEFIDIYLARGLSFVEAQLDDGEFLDVFAVEPRQVHDWIKSGLITDVKTIISWYWLMEFLESNPR
jgi:ADP-ribose pyrophosphatase